MDQPAALTASIAPPSDVPCNLCGARDARHLFTKAGYRLVKCQSCDLAFIANPPDAEAITALYTAKASYHDDLLDPASASFARMRAIALQHIAMLARSTGAAKGLRLLDIGCSNGLFLDEARKAGYDAHGAELSPETSAFARTHFGLPVHSGDWRDAGYADGSFDVVTLFDVIEHLTDPMTELREVRRLLKPGGLLLQSTPDIDGLFPRLSYKVAKAIDYWPHPEPPWHLFQFSTRTLSAMTQKAGYAVARADRTMIGLDYTFGTLDSWKVSPKLVPYALAFAPVAALGKWLGQGDWLYLAARKGGD
ncbi:class I SAM-dependent methyltransferase [Alteraurantiacibacter palmitatis]|uniref:Methyltransferase domain-containing protein n=1 Tax=Alteraurantiacibacter palmitatis TaxID=2054628 RepID=A0ABV7E185_9SPHN